MTSTRGCKFLLSFVLAGTWLMASQAHALAYTGTFLSDSNRYTLVREGDTPQATNDEDDWLRFDPDQTFLFDITGSILTATGPQQFSLQSNNGANVTFTVVDLFLDLSGPNGIAGGSMDYELDGVAGTFTFIERIYGGGSVFNTSTFDGNRFSGFIWGGDSANNLGFDGGIGGNPVPLPGAMLLMGSALAALGIRRKRIG